MQGTSYYQNSVEFYRGLLQTKLSLSIVVMQMHTHTQKLVWNQPIESNKGTLNDGADNDSKVG